MGEVTRVNSRVDQNSQTITVYIEVSGDNLKEGQYLEANLEAKEEPDAIEINRSLLLENNQIFVVRDSILDLMDVKPIFFTDKTVVLKDVPDGDFDMLIEVMGCLRDVRATARRSRDVFKLVSNILRIRASSASLISVPSIDVVHSLSQRSNSRTASRMCPAAINAVPSVSLAYSPPTRGASTAIASRDVATAST